MHFFIYYIVFALVQFIQSKTFELCLRSKYEIKCDPSSIILIKNVRYGHMPILDKENRSIKDWCPKSISYYNSTNLFDCIIESTNNFSRKCNFQQSCEIGDDKSELLLYYNNHCNQYMNTTSRMSIYVSYECYPEEGHEVNFHEMEAPLASGRLIRSLSYKYVKRKNPKIYNEIISALDTGTHKFIKFESNHSFEFEVLENTVYDPNETCTKSTFLQNEYYSWTFNKGLPSEKKINFCKSPYGPGSKFLIENAKTVDLDYRVKPLQLPYKYLLVKYTILKCQVLTVPGAIVSYSHTIINNNPVSFVSIKCKDPNQFLMNHSNETKKLSELLVYCNAANKKWDDNLLENELCVTKLPETTRPIIKVHSTSTTYQTTTLPYENETTAAILVHPVTTQPSKTPKVLLSIFVPLTIIVVLLIVIILTVKYCLMTTCKQCFTQLGQKVNKDLVYMPQLHPRSPNYASEDPLPLLSNSTAYSMSQSAINKHPGYSLISSDVPHTLSTHFSPYSSYRLSATVDNRSSGGPYNCDTNKMCHNKRHRMSLNSKLFIDPNSNHVNYTGVHLIDLVNGSHPNINHADTNNNALVQSDACASPNSLERQASSVSPPYLPQSGQQHINQACNHDYPPDELPSKLQKNPKDSALTKIFRSASNLKNSTLGRRATGSKKRPSFKNRASFLSEDRILQNCSCNTALGSPASQMTYLPPQNAMTTSLHQQSSGSTCMLPNTPLSTHPIQLRHNNSNMSHNSYYPPHFSSGGNSNYYQQQHYPYIQPPIQHLAHLHHQHNSTLSLLSNNTTTSILPTQLHHVSLSQIPKVSSMAHQPHKEISPTIDTYLEPSSYTDNDRKVSKKPSEYVVYEHESSQQISTNGDDSIQTNTEEQKTKDDTSLSTMDQIPEIKSPTSPNNNTPIMKRDKPDDNVDLNDLKRVSMISNNYYGIPQQIPLLPPLLDSDSPSISNKLDPSSSVNLLNSFDICSSNDDIYEDIDGTRQIPTDNTIDRKHMALPPTPNS